MWREKFIDFIRTQPFQVQFWIVYNHNAKTSYDGMKREKRQQNRHFKNVFIYVDGNTQKQKTHQMDNDSKNYGYLKSYYQVEAKKRCYRLHFIAISKFLFSVGFLMGRKDWAMNCFSVEIWTLLNGLNPNKWVRKNKQTIFFFDDISWYILYASMANIC